MLSFYTDSAYISRPFGIAIQNAEYIIYTVALPTYQPTYLDGKWIRVLKIHLRFLKGVFFDAPSSLNFK